MKKYKCIIFDLDGTLVDSLQGILNAVNLTFKDYGMDVVRNREEGLTFIGAGSREFANRALKGIEINDDLREEFIQKFLVHYNETQKTDAKLYDGIKEFIVSLKDNGYKVVIATNKPHQLLLPLIEQLFGEIKFDMLLGNIASRPPKPNPDIIYEIMNELNLKENECLYVGDSEYDYLTAHNANIDSLIVTYGYGFYKEPWLSNATYIVNSVQELDKFLN